MIHNVHPKQIVGEGGHQTSTQFQGQKLACPKSLQTPSSSSQWAPSHVSGPRICSSLPMFGCSCGFRAGSVLYCIQSALNRTIWVAKAFCFAPKQVVTFVGDFTVITAYLLTAHTCGATLRSQAGLQKTVDAIRLKSSR